MNLLHALLMFIARLCIATIFLLAGVGKFINFDQTAAYMASKGLPLIPLLLFGAAAVEILGALLLIFGFRTRVGAAILLIFLIPTTLIFHDFWNTSGSAYALEQIHFLKNLAIFGGLLYVLNSGAGWFSCDACKCKRTHVEDKAANSQEKKYES